MFSNVGCGHKCDVHAMEKRLVLGGEEAIGEGWEVSLKPQLRTFTCISKHIANSPGQVMSLEVQ